MSKTKAIKAVEEIYRRMFKEAVPSANIDKIIASGEGGKPDWFLRYFLSNERQDQIIDEVCTEFKLPKHLKDAVRTETLLGYSPTAVKETWLKARAGGK